MKSLIPSLIALASLAVLAVPTAKPEPTFAGKPTLLCDCDPCTCKVCECAFTPSADTKPTITPAEATSLIIVGPQPKEPCRFCKCRPCECVPEKEGRGPIPVDLGPHQRHTLKDGRQTMTFAEQEGGLLFTQPAPALVVAKPAPKPVAAAGHYQNVQSCGPGGCSVSRVWVPAGTPMPAAVQGPVQYGSCGPGGCGVQRRGLFGRRR